MVAASGAEVLLPARRAAASAAKPPVQDFHDESVTTAPRTTYSETAGATQISEALPEAVATTTRRSGAHRGTQEPTSQRHRPHYCGSYCTSRGRRRKCRHLRGVLYHSSPAPCRSMRTTRRAPARSRPGPAPIGVGGRRRVGRPPSDRLGRRRRCPCRGRSSTVLWLDSGPSQ